MALLSRPTPVSAYIAVLAIVVTLLGLGARHLPLGIALRWGAWAVAAVGIVIAGIRLYKRANARRAERQIERRPADPADAHGAGSGPYRGGVRRIARSLAPPVSGKLAALVVGTALALTAGAVPLVLDLPRWIEIEVVLLGWWAIWCVAFTVLLYRGWRVADDAVQQVDRGSEGTTS